HFPGRDPGSAARGVNLFNEIERLENHDAIKRSKLERRARQLELPLAENGEAGPALVSPVFVEDQLCGYAFVLGTGEDDAFAAQMLDCAATVAAVEMRRLKTKITTEQKLGKVFLKELLAADAANANEL